MHPRPASKGIHTIHIRGLPQRQATACIWSAVLNAPFTHLTSHLCRPMSCGCLHTQPPPLAEQPTKSSAQLLQDLQALNSELSRRESVTTRQQQQIAELQAELDRQMLLLKQQQQEQEQQKQQQEQEQQKQLAQVQQAQQQPQASDSVPTATPSTPPSGASPAAPAAQQVRGPAGCRLCSASWGR